MTKDLKAIDYERVAVLLDIVQRASASGALSDALLREARAELLEINADAQANVAARAAEAGADR